MLCLCGSSALGYRAPLTNVDVLVETNGLDIRVVLRVLDPGLDRVVERVRNYDGSLIGVWRIPQMIVSEGVVAWLAASAWRRGASGDGAEISNIHSNL